MSISSSSSSSSLMTGPDALYLKQNIGDILSKGLAQTILMNPHDKVTYLATWLKQWVETQKREKVAAETLSAQLVVDAKLSAQDEAIQQEQIQNKQKISKILETRTHEFESFLSKAESFDGLFEGFVTLLNHEVGASSTYVAKLQDSDTLQYIATTKEASFLIDQKLIRPQGVTHQLFDATEEESDDESIDEDDEEAVAARAAKKAAKNAIPKYIHVPNVLLGPKSKQIHFHQLPGLGGYMAVKISYDGTLNDETLDEAIEKEIEIENQRQEELEEKKRAAEDESETNTEDESATEDDDDDDEISESERRARKQEKERKRKEAEEPVKIETEEEKATRLKAEAEAKAIADENYLVSQINKQQTNYALCLDTLGQNRRFTPEQVSTILKYSALLIQTIIRIDRRLFKEERSKRAKLIAYTPQERTEDEKQEEMDKISEERETNGKSIDEEDITYVYRTQQLLSIKDVLLSLNTHHVFRGPLQVVQAAMYLLDIEKKTITNVDGQPEWHKIRALLTEELFSKIRDYEPRQPQMNGQDGSTDAYATWKAIARLVKGLEYDEIREKNYAIAELYSWVMDAIAVKRKAAAQRKAEKEAAKRAAEEQAEREAEEKERREAEAENEEEEDNTEATDSTEESDNA